jgi:hypothetical protein
VQCNSASTNSWALRRLHHILPMEYAGISPACSCPNEESTLALVGNPPPTHLEASPSPPIASIQRVTVRRKASFALCPLFLTEFIEGRKRATELSRT